MLRSSSGCDGDVDCGRREIDMSNGLALLCQSKQCNRRVTGCHSAFGESLTAPIPKIELVNKEVTHSFCLCRPLTCFIGDLGTKSA